MIICNICKNINYFNKYFIIKNNNKFSMKFEL